MSLEAALQENTSVMRELIARLTAVSTTAVTMTGAEYVAKLDAAPTAEAAKPTTAAEAVAQAKADAAAAKAQSATTTLDYEKDVRPLLVKLSTAKGREALVALLQSFGAAKGDQLKAEQFAAVVAAVETQLAI